MLCVYIVFSITTRGNINIALKNWTTYDQAWVDTKITSSTPLIRSWDSDVLWYIFVVIEIIKKNFYTGSFKLDNKISLIISVEW